MKYSNKEIIDRTEEATKNKESLTHITNKEVLVIDKEKLKYIALSRFHDYNCKSAFDRWTAALEIYMKQEGYIIVKAPDKDAKGG